MLSLKITLRESKPPIWRRVVMPDGMTLADLHNVIQAVMGWYDSHLHAFDIGGRQYGAPGTLDDVSPEARLTLKDIQRLGIAKFTYTYDFGDDWEHVIEIEKKTVTGDLSAPRCVGGKRAAPPEDCGGIWGYQELLQVLADPEHPDHEEQMECVDEGFSAEVFDLEAANDALSEQFAQ